MLRPVRFIVLAAVLAVFSVSCSADEPFAVDGDLDCENGQPWAEAGSVPDGTRGFTEPADAIARYLTPFQDSHEGDQTSVDEFTGSLVLSGREVVVAVASEAPGGGWLVLTGKGCEGFDR